MQSVTPELVDANFRFIGFIPKKQTKFYEALVTLGNKHLKKPWKQKWSKKNPTEGYCYIVSEVVYHYIAPKGCKVMRLYIPGEGTGTGGNHYFLQWPDGTVVDLTVGQYETVPDYSKAKGCAFQTKDPSNAAVELAGLLGYSEDDLD